MDEGFEVHEDAGMYQVESIKSDSIVHALKDTLFVSAYPSAIVEGNVTMVQPTWLACGMA